jgi:aminoglycoside phosphotransferase (APT) family kinase protein
MPAPRGRDLELTRRRLADWLAAQLPEAEGLRLSELSGPGATGFSSDTLMFDLDYREDDRVVHRPLVVRIQPTGFQVFPEYDLGLQFGIQQALAPTDVPTARMLWREEEAGVLDAPFYVMERVEGSIPNDNPPYHMGGWVTEIRPEERASIWWSGLEVLARIHRLDWRALGLDFLEPEAERSSEPQGREAPAQRGEAERSSERPDGTQLERHLDYYSSFLAWAWDEKPHPTCTPALEWLYQNRPRDPEPVTLCWGDARIGNMVFRDYRCVAVLDWEIARLGSPEEDLAWWLFLDRHHSEGVGVPRLAGFPSREETIARYEKWSGHRVRHLDYYERFAAMRFSVIMARLSKQMQAHGVLPPDSDFGVTNPCSRLLSLLLDSPDPVSPERAP